MRELVESETASPIGSGSYYLLVACCFAGMILLLVALQE